MVDIVSCIIEPAKAAGKWIAQTEPAKAAGTWIAQQTFQRVTYLWCFDTNIKSLKDEATVLDGATKVLQLQVDEAMDNGAVIDPEVVTWLESSKDIQDEASKILDEASTVESHRLKVVDRSSLSKRAKEMTDRSKDLRTTKKDSVKSYSGPSPATRIVPLGLTFECKSRKEIEEEIMTALRGGKVNMIGIWGMGGLGKTTMAKKIKNRALQENVFEEVVIATVSQNVDKSKIQDEIGRQLKLEKLKDKKLEQTERVDLLQCRLLQRKRTLLILDDVWERLVLEHFGIPRDSKWCTILFTSRNSDVLRAMRVETIFGMKALSEEEAWSFFTDTAGTSIEDRELNPIAKQVAKECGGMPINLAAVGAALKDKSNQRLWKDTLRKLKKNVPDSVEYDKETYNPLKLSYENLVSSEAQSSSQKQKEEQEAQSIFLLCCLFPEDADIPLEYLTYFCVGLRIVKEGITNMEDARNKMCALTEFLKDRSLLLESDEKDYVRMHDVVRDVCTCIAKEEGYIGKDGCTWISSSHLVGQRNELLSGSRCPNLELLFLDKRYDSLGFKFDDAFLEGMRELCVLCIRNYRSLTRLPHPTQSLGNLNTLILDSCWELETISVVGKLVNLEILICRHCYSIVELPSEMKLLKSLKVLELTGCYYLKRIGQGIISSLVALEELKMSESFDKWAAEDIKELEALTNLACLEIEIHDTSLVMENTLHLSRKIVRFKITIDNRDIPSKFSKAMCIWLKRKCRLGDWIEKQLLRDTEYLGLRGDGATNVDLAESQNIRWLELRECESMKNVVTTSGGAVFPWIEYLKLDSLPGLQEICDGPISSTFFQYLKELDISNCDSLRNLVQLSMASGKDCLPRLEKLHIKGCKMMAQVFLWNNNSIEPRHVIFPKLKEVELSQLPNLTRFYQGIQGIEFPLLTKLEIESCPKMKSIIMGLVAVPNMKYFQIDEEQIHATKDLNGALQQHYLRHQQKENEEGESSQQKDEIEEENDDD